MLAKLKALSEALNLAGNAEMGLVCAAVFLVVALLLVGLINVLLLITRGDKVKLPLTAPPGSDARKDDAREDDTREFLPLVGSPDGCQDEGDTGDEDFVPVRRGRRDSQASSQVPVTDPCKPLRLAVLRISPELLAEVLKLPAGTRILDVSRDAFFFTHEFGIKVEGPDFEEVSEGRPLPVLGATYREERVVHFSGWDLR